MAPLQFCVRNHFGASKNAGKYVVETIDLIVQRVKVTIQKTKTLWLIMCLSFIGHFRTQAYRLDCIHKRDFYLDLVLSVIFALSFSAVK